MNSLRESLPPVFVACLLAAVGIPAADGQPQVSSKPVPDLDALAPAEPNPFVSFLPADAEPDWEYWRARMARDSLRRAADKSRRQKAQPPRIFEAEPAGQEGANDLAAFGENVGDFGTQAGQVAAVDVVGNLLARPAGAGPFVENDAGLGGAFALDVPAGTTVRTGGIVGDGRYGSQGAEPRGDFDFFRLSARAGERIEVSVRTQDPLRDLDPVTALYDSSGQLLRLNDDRAPFGLELNFDSYLSYDVPADGDFVVVVGGHNSAVADEEDMLPADPFDPASGRGPGSEGKYDVIVGVDAPRGGDLDYFRFDLRAGDVLGAVVTGGAAQVGLYRILGPGVEGSGELVSSVLRDLSALYPEASPLPGGGEAAVAYVVEAAGRYAVGVSRPRDFDTPGYELQLRVFRAGLDGATAPARQVIFLDFDGARLDAGIFPGIAEGEVTLSPLVDFLPRWGLAPGNLDAVIDAIVAAVGENLSADVREHGSNGDFAASGLAGEFDVEVRNSRDHADPFEGASPDAPRVSRVIVGGTIEELGLPTIGLAQTIDPGNFETRESAVVLLDLLSEPTPNANSLNSVERGPGVSVVALVGAGVGLIAAHEAGHLLANFHTQRDGGPRTVMDRGGRPIGAYLSLGEDGVFGTADDGDTDFGPDRYEPAEAFRGLEETLETLSFGLPAGGARPGAGVRPAAVDFGALPVGSMAEQTVTLGNHGSLPVTVTGVAITGADAAAFAVAGTAPPFTLVSGQQQAFEVRFAAVAAGFRQAALEISTADPAAPVLTVSLTGQGGVPALRVEPLEHDFGTIVYGSAGDSLSHVFRVANDGLGELRVPALTFFTGEPAQFTVDTGGAPFVLAGGEEREITLSFRPGGLVGEMTTRLAVIGNDPARPRQDVLLAGLALGPDADVSPVSPYEYGIQEVGTVRFREFEFTNLGQLDLAVFETVLEGPDVDQFTLDFGGGAFTLESRETRRIRVSYRPSVVGDQEARLRLETNDPDEGTFVIDLLATGAVPQLEVEPASLEFGTLVPGQRRSLTLILRNPGRPLLRVSAITVVEEGAAAYTIEDGGGAVVLSEGGEWPVTVAFHPTAPGTYRAALEVLSNDADTSRLLIPLEGEAAAAQFTLAKECQTISSGERLLCTLTATNHGPVVVEGAVVTDELPDPLAWTADDCAAGPPSGNLWTWTVDLPPGLPQSCTLELLAAPGAAGASPTVLNRAFLTTPFTPPGAVEAEATAVIDLAGVLEIPTLSRLGLMLLGILLAMAGWRLVRGKGW